MKLIVGNWYEMTCQDGEKIVGQYMGRQNYFECNVCGKGHRTHTFNVYYSENDYETYAFSDSHLPQDIKEKKGQNFYERN